MFYDDRYARTSDTEITSPPLSQVRHTCKQILKKEEHIESYVLKYNARLQFRENLLKGHLLF